MRMTGMVGARGRQVVGSCLVALVVCGVCAGAVQAAGVPGQGTWETTLQGRDLDGNAANGFEAYYDTALNITWLADASYAKTSGYDVDGYMNWNAAKTWAANLNVNGTTGWRLPTMVDTGASGCNLGYSGTDCGYNVSSSTSELAHLYYVTLGNKSQSDTARNSQPGYGLRNTGPFKNVPGSFDYWSGVEYAPSTGSAWLFNTDIGIQYADVKINEFAAWAVHPGDVASVPEPQTYALALAGLAVTGVAVRRRHR